MFSDTVLKKLEQNVTNIEKSLGIEFKDKLLLKHALIHTSWAVENKYPYNNERLEFLGDSVLSLVVVNFLYTTYPQKTEGELSKLKSILVSKPQLAKWACKINLWKYICVSSAEKACGGEKKESILAGAFEAFLGALYLDQGLQKCKEFLEKFFLSKELNIEPQDYKSMLQEIAQKRFKVLPEYEIVTATGPDHNKEFTSIVKIAGKVLGNGKGKTKKQSEQESAKSALINLKVLKI